MLLTDNQQTMQLFINNLHLINKASIPEKFLLKVQHPYLKGNLQDYEGNRKLSMNYLSFQPARML